MRPPAPSAPGANIAASAPKAAPAAPKPEAPKPAAPNPAAAPAPKPAPAPPKPIAAHADLSDARVRQLYADLVEAKRRQNESTAAMTFQSVAKSLRESGDRLREKHGKSVDFEVMIKDGKAVLRPVLK
jgi:hypothetical protein